jgi:hypothetical protein
MGLKHYHDNHHITTYDDDRPTGGPAFVAHTSGYHNHDDDHHNIAPAATNYYHDHHNYDDAPAHNDDDYARAHNDDESADDQHDPADYLNHVRAAHDDYHNRWVNYFDKPINEHFAANHYDIEGDYHYPPADDYYRRNP